MLETYSFGDGKSTRELKAITIKPEDKPAQIYYCKAYLNDGKTIVVEYTNNEGKRKRIRCDDWESLGANVKMSMDNTKGKAKASGARCALIVKSGTIELLGEVIQLD